MLRKLLALLVVVVVSGVAPATAVVGFCAQMPCCFGDSEGEPTLAVKMADCCSTINCYEAPSQDVNAAAKSAFVSPTTVTFLVVHPPLDQVAAAQLTFDDPSPPHTTSERLASLSLFRI